MDIDAINAGSNMDIHFVKYTETGPRPRAFSLYEERIDRLVKNSNRVSNYGTLLCDGDVQLMIYWPGNNSYPVLAGKCSISDTVVSMQIRYRTGNIPAGKKTRRNRTASYNNMYLAKSSSSYYDGCTPIRTLCNNSFRSNIIFEGISISLLPTCVVCHHSKKFSCRHDIDLSRYRQFYSSRYNHQLGKFVVSDSAQLNTTKTTTNGRN